MKDVVQLGILNGFNKSRIPPKSLGKLPSKKARKPVKQTLPSRIVDEVVAPVLPALVLNEAPVEHVPPFSEPALVAEPVVEVAVQAAPESFPDELLIVTPEPELTPPSLELPLEEPEVPKKKKKKEEPSDQPIELDLKAENTPA